MKQCDWEALEQYRKLYEARAEHSAMPCPRCGNYSMTEENAFSREGIPICPSCGVDEALRRGKPLPLAEWAVCSGRINLNHC